MSKYGRDQDNDDEPDIGTNDDAVTAMFKWLAVHFDNPEDLAVAEGMLKHVVDATSARGVAADEPLLAAGRERGSELATDRRSGMDSATIREMQAIRRAEAEVKPHVGEVIGMDSAAATYEAALSRLGVDTRPLRPFPSAMQASFRTAVRRGNQQHLAMDSKQAKGFAERFPGALKLKVR